MERTTSLRVCTPEGVTFDLPIASPYARCLAIAIDFAVVLSLSALLLMVLSIFSASLADIPILGDIANDFGSGFATLAQFLLFTLYGILTEWLWSGQTLGKRLFKLRVIDERGLSLRFKQIVIRNLFRLLDILPSTFYLIGGISCFLTKHCQRIGDIAAGTLVIRETMPKTPDFRQLPTESENSFARLPHLEARLRRHTTPEEARIAMDAVMRRNELEPEHRLRVFAELAEHFRQRAEFPEDVTFGLSDEQYVRNVVASLFRRASV